MRNHYYKRVRIEKREIALGRVFNILSQLHMKEEIYISLRKQEIEEGKISLGTPFLKSRRVIREMEELIIRAERIEREFNNVAIKYSPWKIEADNLVKNVSFYQGKFDYFSQEVDRLAGLKEIATGSITIEIRNKLIDATFNLNKYQQLLIDAEKDLEKHKINHPETLDFIDTLKDAILDGEEYVQSRKILQRRLSEKERLEKRSETRRLANDIATTSSKSTNKLKNINIEDEVTILKARLENEVDFKDAAKQQEQVVLDFLSNAPVIDRTNEPTSFADKEKDEIPGFENLNPEQTKAILEAHEAFTGKPMTAKRDYDSKSVHDIKKRGR